MPTISPDDLPGRSVLLPPNDEGECFCATIVCKIIDHDKDLLDHPDMIQFLVSVDNECAQDIYAYTNLVDYLNQEMMEQETGENCSDSRISLHIKVPWKPNDPGYKGSAWNVMVTWEDGSETFEPLYMIGKDSPVMVAQ